MKNLIIIMLFGISLKSCVVHEQYVLTPDGHYILLTENMNVTNDDVYDTPAPTNNTTNASDSSSGAVNTQPKVIYKYVFLETPANRYVQTNSPLRTNMPLRQNNYWFGNAIGIIGKIHGHILVHTIIIRLIYIQISGIMPNVSIGGSIHTVHTSNSINPYTEICKLLELESFLWEYS